MSYFADTLVAVASAEIGIKEERPNSGSRIRQYQSATTLKPAAWEWCSAFVCWCLKQTLRYDKVLQELITAGYFSSPLEAEAWRCKSARAFTWDIWGQKVGAQIIRNAEAPAKKGDIVIFDFSHVGIVAFDEVPTENKIHTVEGNTNITRMETKQGVSLKHRVNSPSIIFSYVRIST